MKGTITSLALASLLAAAVAVPVLAQRGPSAANDAGPRWERGAGSLRGGMGPMGGRARAGARLLGPEGRLLRDPGRLADELKLTSQQQEKLRNIGEDLARRAIRSRADLQVAQLDLGRALRDDSANRSAIEGQVDAIAKLQGDMMKAAVSARLDARSVLTAEQRRQLAEMRPAGGRRDGATRPGAERPGAERRQPGLERR